MLSAVRKFNRYELKYVMRTDESARLIERLGEFIDTDAHGDAEGGYPVSSLYYDSPRHDCFWSKLDGIKFRRKLRVRAYGNELGDPAPGQVWVEIKQRVNKTVQKRRLGLPLEQALSLCAGDEPPGSEDAVEREVALEVQYLVHAMNLEPACVISYRRRAFQGGTQEAGLRVTFDVDLRSRTHELVPGRSDGDHYFLPPDLCIMEIKVNERVPLWLTSILGAYDCMLTRVSKYCLGMMARHEDLANAYVPPAFAASVRT